MITVFSINPPNGLWKRRKEVVLEWSGRFHYLQKLRNSQFAAGLSLIKIPMNILRFARTTV